MSTDLSRPLVPSMGLHDALDGYVTYREIETSRLGMSGIPGESLVPEIDDMEKICQGTTGWATPDPLGTGGLLFDASRLAQLAVKNRTTSGLLIVNILEAACTGVVSFAKGESLESRAGYRLAFRELGLSIGLHGTGIAHRLIAGNPELFPEKDRLDQQVRVLLRYSPIAHEIEQFWLQPINRDSRTWKEHKDINTVMLATSLLPEGFLLV